MGADFNTDDFKDIDDVGGCGANMADCCVSYPYSAPLRRKVGRGWQCDVQSCSPPIRAKFRDEWWKHQRIHNADEKRNEQKGQIDVNKC